jgi:hypothetical protein
MYNDPMVPTVQQTELQADEAPLRLVMSHAYDHDCTNFSNDCRRRDSTNVSLTTFIQDNKCLPLYIVQ